MTAVREIVLLALAVFAGVIAAASAVAPCDGVFTFRVGTRQRFSVTVGKEKREVLLYVPAVAEAARLPLVVNWHGNPSDAKTQADYTEMDALAAKRGFYVAYPVGVDESFNAGGCCAGNTEDDLGFARALVAHIARGGCVDMSRVFTTGWSNGGYMCYYLACKASDLFRAAAVVGGLSGIDPEGRGCRPETPMPILHLHATGDPEVSYAGGGDEWMGAEELVGVFAGKQGCDVASLTTTYSRGEVTCRSHTGCPAHRNATICTIERNHHAWPGASCAGCPEYQGTKDISANEAMWQFFSAVTESTSTANSGGDGDGDGDGDGGEGSASPGREGGSIGSNNAFAFGHAVGVVTACLLVSLMLPVWAS